MHDERSPNELPEIPADPRPAEYQRLAREISTTDHPSLEPVSIAMLGSSTLELIRPVFTVEGARRGLSVDLFLGDFGQLEQPVLQESSDLYQARPDALVLAFQPTDLFPDAFDRFYATEGAQIDEVCSDLTDRLVSAARTFRERSGRPVLVANYALPVHLPLGPFDAGRPGSLTHRMHAQNARLAEATDSEADIYVWDYAGLVREVGSRDWTDPRLQGLAKVSTAAEHQPAMVRHLLRTLSAVRRRPAKCLVLDLDNTVWGGVIGDDGIEGLLLGDDWPGIAYKAFQRAVMGLRDRGVLLAVVSKNDEPVAANAFRNHPEMLIGWDDLAAVRINWEPKSGNMRAIAEELNIGVDSLVLFDDNPVERAEVRANVPEAGVVEVPTDPTRYREALLTSGFFDQPELSVEDRKRADMYQVERQRTDLRRHAQTMEDFLRSLEMRAEVGTASTESLGRIVQLIGKTNQFNLTTRRHPPAEVSRMVESEDFVVGSLRLSDRFGDQGLIAVGILERRDDEGWIDTFLMSCRVMNRGVERAMMSYLLEWAEALGCTRVIGEYRPTAKNHMVERLYADLGFAPYGESDGGTLWSTLLPAEASLWPDHIERSDLPEASPALEASR